MNPAVRIESLDQEGHGVARLDGKVAFVDGALTGEQVEISVYRRHPKYDSAQTVRVLRASPYRATPACPHFNRCGGCSLQHLEASAQVAVKQRVLEENLARIGKVSADIIAPAIHGPTWGYRHRARLSVRRVDKKGGVLVGFHEKRSSFITEMESCPVLHPRVSRLILPLRRLIARLSIVDRLPQIEVAVGDRVIALVLRVLDLPNSADEDLLRAFAAAHDIQLWLQPKGPDSAYPFFPLQAPQLDFRLHQFDLALPFRPTEFTQVNPGINEALVNRAVHWLAPQSGERIGDFFCGLGNFTLPIARLGAEVLGIEGNAALVARARENACLNGLALARFEADDLFQMTPEKFAALGQFDKLLIDPPRDGAMALVKSLPPPVQGGTPGLYRIVYVSYNPATLARDAEVLCHVQGFHLKAAGVANMFPHTAHVESVAWFER